ncbi:Crp/Fnr family transcriptional regulator [Niabella pedocola]|uniref:Crp/Fnr family transcriptional regulator n=1 Tax=Niabella pedocola TaxID=1752077 RepID=A0ABS8PXE6_9BACT|nr:Crp/Fnr family transcriptional regulator [Niabella pedocola]MCD2425760.1 Crp/Fnr family transcriptional regulator [Niabella pedocola]
MRDHTYHLLQEHIQKHISVTPDELSFFLMLLKRVTYHKNQVLLREGENCLNFAFILSGCIKSYLIDKKGEEHILTIAPEGWWVADVKSFITNEAGNLFLEAIEPTQAALLSRANQALLLEKTPRFERYFRVLTERAFAMSQQRILDAMSLTASERFDKFRLQYPSLTNRLTHRQIASYIGVTPSFFSRMLKQRK